MIVSPAPPPYARVKALSLANEYAGTHANNTPEQVIERAEKYAGFLSAGETPEVAEGGESAEDFKFSISCDVVAADTTTVLVNEDVVCVGNYRADSCRQALELSPCKARRFANALLEAAELAEAARRG